MRPLYPVAAECIPSNWRGCATAGGVRCNVSPRRPRRSRVNKVNLILNFTVDPPMSGPKFVRWAVTMASAEDLFPGASEDGLRALRFYEDNYSPIGEWIIEPGKKIMLGDRVNRTCRFCGKRSPEVTFEKQAHAIPECLGNKSLFTAYECDACNGFFGTGIENDFGNWSKPQHILGRIRQKGRAHGEEGFERWMAARMER